MSQEHQLTLDPTPHWKTNFQNFCDTLSPLKTLRRRRHHAVNVNTALVQRTAPLVHQKVSVVVRPRCRKAQLRWGFSATSQLITRAHQLQHRLKILFPLWNFVCDCERVGRVGRRGPAEGSSRWRVHHLWWTTAGGKAASLFGFSHHV